MRQPQPADEPASSTAATSAEAPGEAPTPRADPPPTEAALDTTRDLDRWDTARILVAIHAEDRRAVEAVGGVLTAVARAVEALEAVLRGGGRLFYVGAGTSGRMGLLDAAELPPTFGIEPDRVQAVLAGGPAALERAVEGAEDRGEDAAVELRRRGLGARDAVLAISASGRTPFALAGLREARRKGAVALALTCDPDSPLAREAELAIVPEVGPEVIAGSTRMKGGLAQKMVLHLLSTATMVRLGRVRGNLMAHLRPGSAKLRRRAREIVARAGGISRDEAARLLAEHGGDVQRALAALQRAGGGEVG